MSDKKLSWWVSACLYAGLLICQPAASASASTVQTSSQALFPYLAANGKYGFVTEDGHMVIEPTYEEAEPFVEDRAAVRFKDRWGFIDTNGRWIVAPKYTHVWAYRNGEASAAIVTPPTRRGLVDINPFHHSGKIVNYRFDKQGHRLETWRGDVFDVSPSERARFESMPRTSRPAAPANCQCAFVSWMGFVDGFAVVAKRGQPGLGIIDQQGNLVVGYQKYDDLRHPVRGFFVGHGVHGWGILDASRNVEVVPFDRADLDQVKILDEGSTQLALAVQRDNKTWDVLDPSGKVLRAGFHGVWGARENVIAVQNGAGLVGALSPDGEWIFPPRYHSLFTFKGGLARVTSNKQEFYIDRQGHEYRDPAPTSKPAPASPWELRVEDGPPHY